MEHFRAQVKDAGTRINAGIFTILREPVRVKLSGEKEGGEIKACLVSKKLIEPTSYSISDTPAVADLSISSVNISYVLWERNQHSLREEYERKTRRAEDMEREFQAKKSVFEARDREVGTSHSAYIALMKKRDAERAKAYASGPEDKAKSSYYKMVEQKLAKDAARMDQIVQYFTALKGNSANTHPDTIDRLLKEYDELQVEQENLENELNKLQDKMGFTKARAEAEARYQQLDQAAFNAYKIFYKDVSERDVAMKAAERAQDERDYARDDAENAEMDWTRLREVSSPLITSIRVYTTFNDYYKAEVWNPREVLERNRHETEDLRTSIDKFYAIRWEARKDFMNRPGFRGGSFV